MAEKVIVLYVPVIHSGYLRFLEKWSKEADMLFILSPLHGAELGLLEKEIRSLVPAESMVLISALKLFKTIEFLNYSNSYQLKNKVVVMANDELSRRFAKKWLANQKVIFDDVFLRWDETSVLSKREVKHDTRSSERLDLARMDLAAKESKHSSDWWRRVGCVLVKNGKVIKKVYNRHLPSEHTPYAVGDPRDFIKAGTRSELSSALHCEQAIIAWAANKGISLKRTRLYVTVFPCPVCAKLIAYSGITKLFYASGHASLDGVDILKDRRVEIILVKK